MRALNQKWFKTIRSLFTLVLVLTLFTVSVPTKAAAADVTIGTQTFTETKILAEMYKALIEDRTDLTVDIKTDLAASSVVLRSIAQGEVDMGTLYSGEIFNGYFEIEDTKDRAAVLRQAQEGFDELYNLKWYDPLGFENTYTLAVRPEVAEQYGLSTMSDLKEHAGNMSIGVDTTWLERPADGYPAFTKEYGYTFASTSPMEISLVYQAVADKIVDVVLAYTTDPGLKEFNLVTLEDDKQFFPPFDASTVVKKELLAEYPELDETLSLLIGTIDADTMTDLNYQVDVNKMEPKNVALMYLVDQGLLDESKLPASVMNPDAPPLQKFGYYLTENASYLWNMTWVHIVMVLCGLGLALVIGIPLGIISARYQRTGRVIMFITNIIQVLPSLALLALLMVLVGLGNATVVVGLFLYSLNPVVRNTYVGLSEVNAGIKDAGKGMGMSPLQLLWKVEMPLSLPFLMAGLRVAAVIAIGVATLAPLIGGDGLGREIYAGLNQRHNIKILAGAIPAALLAILADIILGRLSNRFKVAKS
ncbi:glycine betaine ABC transporter substrate-binding protein [Paenibacillus sp. PDC88]|uniref:glycine betaine ABC transporter substrate-binding protein n=1 Tax=Paenibacillus sp. PDC88 TaxID=1884375 RepID=UPI000899440F|nr:osmoprotectant transport system permease protein [Paenibacillus sp. PDC88]